MRHLPFLLEIPELPDDPFLWMFPQNSNKREMAMKRKIELTIIAVACLCEVTREDEEFAPGYQGGPGMVAPVSYDKGAACDSCASGCADGYGEVGCTDLGGDGYGTVDCGACGTPCGGACGGTGLFGGGMRRWRLWSWLVWWKRPRCRPTLAHLVRCRIPVVVE